MYCWITMETKCSQNALNSFGEEAFSTPANDCSTKKVKLRVKEDPIPLGRGEASMVSGRSYKDTLAQETLDLKGVGNKLTRLMWRKAIKQLIAVRENKGLIYQPLSKGNA